MPKEPEDAIGTLAESRQAGIHPGMPRVNADRSGNAEMLFDMAVAALLGIQGWGVQREAFHCSAISRGGRPGMPGFSKLPLAP
jgi:hypothetical protein